MKIVWGRFTSMFLSNHPLIRPPLQHPPLSKTIQKDDEGSVVIKKRSVSSPFRIDSLSHPLLSWLGVVQTVVHYLLYAGDAMVEISAPDSVPGKIFGESPFLTSSLTSLMCGHVFSYFPNKVRLLWATNCRKID